MKVNVVTGFLGAGKTTLIKSFLSQKPESEEWAIIVNEFGEVGIDGSLLANDSGGHIYEIPGGCICCTSGVELHQTIKDLLKNRPLDRLIIEPTGLGHPGGILDTLQSSLPKSAELMAIITLVDPRNLDSEKHMGNHVFQDQIIMSDILVANKIDLSTELQLQPVCPHLRLPRQLPGRSRH